MSELASLINEIDVQHLLEARLWVARLGESDVNGWWRTDGILGTDGAFVGPRVLPVTHPTARSRIAFAVATHACSERYPDPRAHHLFKLTPELEDRLDQLLVDRLGDGDFWASMMKKLETVSGEADSADVLREGGVVSEEHLTYAAQQPMGPAERSLPIAATTATEALGRLTAGFVRSRPGNLAVPYLAGDK